jgi:hypothetical protein
LVNDVTASKARAIIIIAAHIFNVVGTYLLNQCLAMMGDRKTDTDSKMMS